MGRFRRLACIAGAAEDRPLRFLLRAVTPEVNGAFKGADAAARNVLGMWFSEAYAEDVLSYLSGAWDDDTTSTRWWSVLIEALKLPPAQHEYRSGFVRLLELYSLAGAPGEPLPNSGGDAAFAGADPVESTDCARSPRCRCASTAGRRSGGSSGRSVAYEAKRAGRDRVVTAS